MGDLEVLRMINHLVRDKNWNTITQVIENEVIDDRGDSFSIKYDCRVRQHQVDFLWECQIEGTADCRLEFSIRGRALSAFKRNRIGFTVLHPNRECQGQPVTIWHSDDSSEDSVFPRLISPHQPFMDIKAMQWYVGGNCAKLSFSGEVFETEDQRNWTDDSFKTYCTPLAIPFPQQLEVGDTVEQKIQLNITQDSSPAIRDASQYSFEVLPQKYQLPLIGVGRSSEVDQLTADQEQLLTAVNFDHYQVDLKLFDHTWETQFENAVAEALRLNTVLELSLFFKQVEPEIAVFLEIAARHQAHIGIINVFDFQSSHTSEYTLNKALKPLKAICPDASVGAGTNAFFTELNRNRVSHDALDHLVYSVNPQVHAFDNDSLVESLFAQPATVDTALSFSNGRPIHISPITFKMRWNPNATESDDSGTDNSDIRQGSLFGAGWVVCSLQNLITTDLKAVTYFESIGSKGIIMDEQLFPMYFVFQYLLQRKQQDFQVLSGSDPLLFGGLVVGQNELLLVNYSDQNLTIHLPKSWHHSKVQIVDADNVWNLMTKQSQIDQLSIQQLSDSVVLTSFALAFLQK